MARRITGRCPDQGPQQTPTRPTRVRGPLTVPLVTVLLVTVLLAGCGNGDSAGPADTDATGAVDGTASTTTAPPTTSQPATTTTTEPATEEEAILAAVDGFWQSFFAANQPPNPQHPDLRRYRTGAALEIAVANVQQRQTLSQYVRLPASSRFRSDAVVLERDGPNARVHDCVIDDSELVQAPDNILLDSELETTLFEMELVMVEEQWKVAATTITEQWEGEHPCVA